MRVILNGRPTDVPEGSTVAEVIKGEPHEIGTAFALIRPMEKVRKGTDEFQLTTIRGSFVLKLNDSDTARAWRDVHAQTSNKIIRWETSKVIAVGSFPTDLQLVKGRAKYHRYEAFLSLGGFDNRTTYLMIARTDHEGEYGLASGVIGHVTRGRHVLSKLREGDQVSDVTPIVIDMSSKDAYSSLDLGTVIEDGMSIETFVHVDLDRRSPVSCEHFLVASGKGKMKLTERTASYTASSSRMDVALVSEHHEVRQRDMVTVRAEGSGAGRVYFYKQRRQVNLNHNVVGMVTAGQQLIHLVPDHADVTLVTRPSRLLTVGMTQKQAGEFLSSRGLRQSRKGAIEDEGIVVEQEPELTMEIQDASEVETFAVASDAVRDIELYGDAAPQTVNYVRKMTGLDHKQVGTMKVHFTFEGMPLITFEGNPTMASGLVPENAFTTEKGVARGEIGVTNMSRPLRGLMGVRLEASSEFGPTGEEDHGTNIIGRIVSDVAETVKGLKDGDIVYLRVVERAEGEVTAKRPKLNGKKKAEDEAKPKRERSKADDKADAKDPRKKTSAKRSSKKEVSDAAKD